MTAVQLDAGLAGLDEERAEPNLTGAGSSSEHLLLNDCIFRCRNVNTHIHTQNVHIRRNHCNVLGQIDQFSLTHQEHHGEGLIR